MSDIDGLRADLQAARAELLAAVAGIAQAEFERHPAEAGDRRSILDVLWHVGLKEDWLRRVISQAMSGAPLAEFHDRQPPAIARTPEYLVEWLDQCRRPTLSLLGRVPQDRLDETFTLPTGEVRTARGLFEEIARHDRGHAAQVATLRAAGSRRD